MPSYDYACQDCNQHITLERSMTDESKPLCSHCGSTSLNRIWNVFMLASGSSPDKGQPASSSSVKKGGCGSCSSHACGTCH